MSQISYYAKHKTLDVAARFETETSRDDYIKKSLAANHPWEACSEDDAKNIVIKGGTLSNIVHSHTIEKETIGTRDRYRGIDKDGHEFVIDVSFGKNEKLAKMLGQDPTKDYIAVDAQYNDGFAGWWDYCKKADPLILGLESIPGRYRIVKLIEHTGENVRGIVGKLTGASFPQRDLQLQENLDSAAQGRAGWASGIKGKRGESGEPAPDQSPQQARVTAERTRD